VVAVHLAPPARAQDEVLDLEVLDGSLNCSEVLAAWRRHVDAVRDVARLEVQSQLVVGPGVVTGVLFLSLWGFGVAAPIAATRR
jgi:hypothetical protein